MIRVYGCRACEPAGKVSKLDVMFLNRDGGQWGG